MQTTTTTPAQTLLTPKLPGPKAAPFLRHGARTSKAERDGKGSLTAPEWMLKTAGVVMRQLPDAILSVGPSRKPGKFQFSASSGDWCDISEEAQRLGYHNPEKWFKAIRRKLPAMVEIPLDLTDEEDAILTATAEEEGRTKSEQLRHAAVMHSRSILPDDWTFKAAT